MLRFSRNAALTLACFIGMSSFAKADDTNYVYFFTANNSAYQAYFDSNNQTRDAAGNLVVNVKLDSMSATFRDWIKQYFPGGEGAAYVIDPYSVDCTNKLVGEHVIVYYDANGLPLTSYDYGGKMQEPITGSMKFYLLQKVCGQ